MPAIPAPPVPLSQAGRAAHDLGLAGLLGGNMFGRQVRSFEADLVIPGIDGDPVRAVFIRAPWIAEHGDAVEILAEVDGHPVAARQDAMLVISFHPEIAGEPRVHELFLHDVQARAAGDFAPRFGASRSG